MDQQLILIAFLVLAIGELFIIVYFWHLDGVLSRLRHLISGDSYQENSDRAYGVIHRAYEKEIAAVTAEISKTMYKETDRATKAFDDYLAELRSQSTRLEEFLAEETGKEIRKMLNNFQGQLNSALSGMQEKSLIATEEEFVKVKKAVEDYRERQLAAIDQNAVAIVEKVTAEVLGKKMTLADQIDLITETLEKAKKEGIISNI